MYLEFLNFDVNAAIGQLREKYEEADKADVKEIRSLVNAHRKARLAVADALPESQNIGMFLVDTASIRTLLFDKHHGFEQALLELLAREDLRCSCAAGRRAPCCAPSCRCARRRVRGSP